MIQYFTRLKTRLFSILVLTTLSYNISVAQQYTITDDDVVVENGVIKSCSYNFEIKDIIIPEILDGQVVKSINGSPDPENDTEPFGFCRRRLKSVKLPGTLTSIGDFAFAVNNISTLVIPDGVTKIGNRAFYLAGLDEVIIPNSVETIDEYAFSGNRLVSVNIPNKLKIIEKDLFSYNKLTRIVIPDNVQVIEYNSFCGNDITELILPEGLKRIECYAFSNNDITNINLPDGLERIATCAFSVNKLTNVVIPGTVKVVERSSFVGNKLETVVLSEGVVVIERRAFELNKISKIELPSTLTKLYPNAFSNNKNLNCLILPKPNVGDMKFTGWIDNEGNEYSSGSKITNFETSYFATVEYTLTDNDVVVEDGIIKQVDYNLQATSITIPSVLDGQTVVAINDGNAIHYSCGRDVGVFNYKGLVAVKLPETLLEIGNHAFSDNQLRDIDIPAKVVRIGIHSFSDNKIKSINFPESIRNIEGYAFWYNELESIVIPDNVISIGGRTFGHNNLSKVKIPESITSIERNTFSNNKLTNIVIPSNIIEIKSEAFAHNELTSVDIPSSVQYLGKNAFNFNMSLNYIDLPKVFKNGASFSGWKNENGDIISGGTRVTDLETPYEAIVSDLNTNQIVLFPNPVSYELTVSSGSEIKKIEICTIQGKVIITKHINKQTTAYIDVSALSSGVYIVKVTQGNSSKSLRMVKQ
ncbi:MAG: leucine-rich repeat protein [Bacteroidales bacterium]|nr:leucine-rich repeat protein [Bacteroidales bacterium]